MSSAAVAPRPVHAAHGMHCLVDCYGVAADLLTDVASLRTLLRAAAEAAGAHVLFDHFHAFGVDPSGRAGVDGVTPGQVGVTGVAPGQAGVTGVVLLAESHASIHTWPDDRFAAIDLFLCGDTDPDRALACLERGLKPERSVVMRRQRGLAT